MKIEQLLKLENQNLFMKKETALKLFNPVISQPKKDNIGDIYPIGSIGTNTVYVNTEITDDNIYGENGEIIQL